jgi:hypothetical protein
MPFNPHAEYTGWKTLAAGIAGAGSSIGDALQTYEKDKANAAWGDTTFDWIAKNAPGAIPPETLAKYHKASAKERAQMALGAQWNAVQGLGVLAKQQAMDEPFVNVNGQLFSRPGAPRPVYATSSTEAGKDRRFQIREDERRRSAQVKLAQGELKNTRAQLEDMGFTGEPGELLDSSLHKGGVVVGGKFTPSDPNDPKTPQTHIQVAGGGYYDIPTVQRMQRIAKRYQGLRSVVDQSLQQQAGAGAGGGAAGTGGIVTVTSPAQARALPAGTRYRAPDGKVRVAPGQGGAAPAAAAGTGYDEEGDGEDGSTYNTDEEDNGGPA